ncbi:MAG: hypothetical protein ACE37L_13405 [Allomuricauda sp.]
MLVLVVGCTDEPTTFDFIVSIKNETSETFKVEAYNVETIVYQIDLSNNETGPTCSYVDENFRGILYNYCGIDSLIIKFQNNHGYISTRNNSGNFNFSNKRNPLLPNGGFDVTGNTHEFIVSQEDFENAFELPE